MKHLIYIFFGLICTISLAQNTSVFDQAGKLYNDAKYTEAISMYETIVDTGMHSPELYFNLANAHYKLNHIAPSIYYYEKALQLKPKDKDILNNIAFARNMTIDAIDSVPEVGLSKFIKSLTNTFSFDTWAKLTVAFMISTVILFLMYYFAYISNTKRLAFIGSITFLILTCIALTLAFNKYGIVKNDRPAIVFSQESKVKSEPNLRSSEAFRLHEGTKVQVLDTINNWKKIKLSDGKTGWIASEDIKLLSVF